MNGTETIIITKDQIKLSTDNETSAVMHVGEKTLIEKLSEIVTTNGGNILEIGFGMHLSADAIQCNPNVTLHTIIEIHPEIYKTAIEWAKDKKNVNIILGDWLDVLPLNEVKFDGILHDTHLDKNIDKFLDYVKPNCKEGTIVGFFEYQYFDTRFDGVRHSLMETEYNNLIYKNNIYFKENQYELKYTIFDGVNFKRSTKTTNKKLL
jgi:hypothetical protein